MFCFAKDTIPALQKSSVIYYLTYPGCNKNCIGEKDCNLVLRLYKHSLRDQPIHQHLLKCEHYMDIVNLLRLPDIDSASTSTVIKEYLLNTILSNFRVVDSFRSWSRLLFLEPFYIKALASKIFDGPNA